MKIVGLDPGSRWAGFGVIELSDGNWKLCESGTIAIPVSKSFPEKLSILAVELEKIYLNHRPNITVVENIFLGKNTDSAFKLGQVRGVCLLKAQQGGSKTYEYAARKVKKVVTGSGAASKEEVQLILSRIFLGADFSSLDASDATALAYCHGLIEETQKQLRPLQGDSL